MRTTGIFTVHKHEIKFDKYNEPLYLVPFGDIHRSSPHCDVEKWEEFLNWARRKPRCYFLGMGDYDDLASTSERDILGNPNLHDSTRKTLEKYYDYHTKNMAKSLAFMKGRIVGMIEGNHYSQFQDGTTTTQRLCQYLGCKYLGVTSFIALCLRHDVHHSHQVVIWAHHGLGAGRTIGGSINKVEQMEKVAEADIYLMGHDHRKSIGMLNKFCLKPGGNRNQVIHVKKVLLGRTGSFLKGYVQNESSYIADAGLAPTDLGVIKIELTPRLKKFPRVIGKPENDERYIDIHGSL